jgi:Putative zinc-finger
MNVHERIAELMPWYVNGTLSDEEHAGVEKHLNECLPCRAALREERQIQSLVRAQDDVPLGAGHGVADLLQEIDRGGKRAAPRPLRPRLGLGLSAAAVAGAMIAAWILLTPPSPQTSVGSTSFTTLTDGGDAAANRIDIVFSDTTDEAEIRRIIASVGATLVSGPSSVGRYTVSVPAESAEDLKEIVDRLTADPRVRFAGQNYIASPSIDSGAP